MENQEPFYFVKPTEIQLSNHQIESAKRVFNLFDVNKNGDISRDELKKAFEKFGKVLSENELDIFFDKYDIDGSNTIDFDEYLKVVQYQFANISNTLSNNEVFKGKFTPEEFKVLLEFITIKNYKKDDQIQRTGEPSRETSIILHGEIQTSCEQTHVDITESTSYIFGTSAFTEQGSQSSCVKAISDVVLATFDVKNLEMLLLRDSHLYRKLKGVFDIESNSQDEEITKYVALIAHNNMKKTMVSFVKKHLDFYSNIPIVGTLSTGSILFDQLGISLSKKVASGPLGGDQAVGALIAPGQLSAVFFFKDPLTSHPHQADIEALCRLCDVYQVPYATNPCTAEALVMYLEHHGLDYNQDESTSSNILDQYFMTQGAAVLQKDK